MSDHQSPGSGIEDSRLSAVVRGTRELAQKAGMFGEAARVSPLPMIITDPGLQGAPIVFANEAFLGTTGYTIEEVLGREPTLLGGAGTARDVFQRLHVTLAEGRSDSAELVCYRRDGSSFPAVLLACPVTDQEGQVKFFFSCLDMSKHAPLHHSQTDTEQCFRLLVEAVTDYAIYMLDPEGCIVSWNPGAERIKGYSADEVIGLDGSMFHTEEDRRRGVPQKTLQTASREGRVAQEGWRVRKDGSKFLAHVVVEAIRNETGELIGFAKVTRDITDRHRAREAERASEAKTQFLASMSHEIRTPLNALIGYTERLMDEDLTPNQYRYGERIQTAGSALLTIIGDILDLSEIEAGEIQLSDHPFSLDALVDSTVSIIAGAAEAKGISLRVMLDPSLPAVLVGDGARLRQVLLNLLNNAVKFTHKGQVSLVVQSNAHPGGSELRFSVIDTGIGIPMDKRDRLFRRFSQVDSTTRREFGGSGLGLAISKRLVELMGGEIGLESEEGRGSTFWFTVALPEGSPEDIANSEERVPQLTESARILLAEDLEINQELARSILEKAGHHVDVVENGAEAVAAVKTGNYDLVLMDIQMPVMDGLSATKEIRALSAPTCKVPIIAMTANVLAQQIRGFRQAGMDDYIGKPMTRGDILNKLSEWLPSLSPLDQIGPGISKRPVFDQKAFESLCELVDLERTKAWLERLRAELDSMFAGKLSVDGERDQLPVDGERDQLRPKSHAIVSQAGTLGFFELSDACRKLEEACISGGEIEARFKDARRAAQRAGAVITELKQRLSKSD